jgi:NRPS condensation-like uncharacterized protein
MKIEDLHTYLPEKIPAEISDCIQFFLRTNADQQMRYVIYLSQQLNVEILTKALLLTIYTEAIFSYTYKEDAKKAYWQKQEHIDSSTLIDLIETDSNAEYEINRFLLLVISPFEFPLVKARIIRNGQKDVLCINMNHTPTDGAGLKEFVKILALHYTNLIENPDYLGDTHFKNDRSIIQVTKNFSFYQKLQFIKQSFRKPKRTPSWSFDWNKEKLGNKNQLSILKITSKTFNKLKAFGKLNNATVNDVILSAFIRVFIATNPKNEKAVKPIIVPVDLRKYIKDGHKTAICSLTGSMICNIGTNIGDTFIETLVKVRDEMNYKKQIHAEIFMLAPFLVMSKFTSYDKLKEQSMQRKLPPIPLVTNVGVINPSDINFNGISVEYAFVTGAISYEEYFSMGYSTFNNEPTFSIGFTGDVLQLQKVKIFLDNFKNELEKIQ